MTIEPRSPIIRSPVRAPRANAIADASSAPCGANASTTDLLQLDGVGGGSTLTSKVAIVSPSDQPGCDVDYLFAQVGVGQRSGSTPSPAASPAAAPPFANNVEPHDKQLIFS